jgi:fructoselysine-6-P-deglycase FrlB-like protein
VSFVEQEIATQPDCWRRAAALATRLRAALPGRGQRVAIVGCGTSLFVGQAMAALREGSGHGETDAFPASELPAGRRYDAVVALSRSGTTTEVLAALDALAAGADTTLAITADHRQAGCAGTAREVWARAVAAWARPSPTASCCSTRRAS